MADKTGAELISEERQRQIDEEGYTLESDKMWPVHHFVLAAGAYLGLAKWPWRKETFRPKNGEGYYVKRNLVKAGALIAAAIDRLGEN